MRTPNLQNIGFANFWPVVFNYAEIMPVIFGEAFDGTLHSPAQGTQMAATCLSNTHQWLGVLGLPLYII